MMRFEERSCDMFMKDAVVHVRAFNEARLRSRRGVKAAAFWTKALLQEKFAENMMYAR
jgi:hypothetical protein